MLKFSTAIVPKMNLALVTFLSSSIINKILYGRGDPFCHWDLPGILSMFIIRPEPIASLAIIKTVNDFFRPVPLVAEMPSYIPVHERANSLEHGWILLRKNIHEPIRRVDGFLHELIQCVRYTETIGPRIILNKDHLLLLKFLVKRDQVIDQEHVIVYLSNRRRDLPKELLFVVIYRWEKCRTHSMTESGQTAKEQRVLSGSWIAPKFQTLDPQALII